MNSAASSKGKKMKLVYKNNVYTFCKVLYKASFHEQVSPLILRFPVVCEVGSLQWYSPASSIRRPLIIRILFLPSVICSYLPTSGNSWSPLYHVTSALGLETSQISLTLSVSVPSILAKFFVNLASSSVVTKIVQSVAVEKYLERK